jgi:hypothetical protein
MYCKAGMTVRDSAISSKAPHGSRAAFAFAAAARTAPPETREMLGERLLKDGLQAGRIVTRRPSEKV